MSEVIIESGAPSKEDCNFAVVAHLLGMFTSFLAPIIVFLMTRDKSNFVSRQATEALNFQITFFLIYLVCVVLKVVLIGFLLLPIAVLVNWVFCIIAAIAVSKGQAYTYPFSLRLFQ
ncbi:DUF4870 domain-containing protein [Massilia sp. W12]|uniref:DUF4870 domain-containing protein n=1 Tax=Massilia sp. W12 TaxID=3126507 RepID=UPI0030D545BD